MEQILTSEKREQVKKYLDMFAFTYTECIGYNGYTAYRIDNFSTIAPSVLKLLTQAAGQFPYISVENGKLEISFLY